MMSLYKPIILVQEHQIINCNKITESWFFSEIIEVYTLNGQKTEQSLAIPVLAFIFSR